MLLKEQKLFKDISVIYGILNKFTNKWYIGSCKSMKNRMHRHYYYLIHNNHHSQKLQRSWNKYGEDAFEVIILYYLKDCEISIMSKIEEDFICKYNSKENGYNMTDVCWKYQYFKQSEEAKKKVGRAHSIPIVAIDRFTNEKVKIYNSITDAAKDIKDSTSNISQVCKHKCRYAKNFVFVYLKEYDPDKDYRVINHHMKGVAKSDIWKSKARKSNKQAKKTYKFDLQYNLIEEYTSRNYAEKCNNLRKESLRYLLNKYSYVIVDDFIYSYNAELKI